MSQIYTKWLDRIDNEPMWSHGIIKSWCSTVATTPQFRRSALTEKYLLL